MHGYSEPVIPVQQAQPEPEEGERHEVQRRRRAGVHAAEDEPRDHRRRPCPTPVAQRREDEAPEQELLADRRDHARQRGAEQQQRRAFVGAELFRGVSLLPGLNMPDQITLNTRNTRNRPNGSMPTPAAIRCRGGRRPNCQARTFAPADLREQYTAARTNDRPARPYRRSPSPGGVCEDVMLHTEQRASRAGRRSGPRPPPARARRSAPPAPSTAASPFPRERLRGSRIGRRLRPAMPAGSSTGSRSGATVRRACSAQPRPTRGRRGERILRERSLA